MDEGVRPLDSLSADEVGSLLASNGQAKYAALCRNVPLTGRDLIHCVEGDLTEIGIGFRPHRLSILELVRKLHADGVPQTMLDEAEEPSWLTEAQQDLGGGSEPTWLADAQESLRSTLIEGEFAHAENRCSSGPTTGSSSSSSSSSTTVRASARPLEESQQQWRAQPRLARLKALADAADTAAEGGTVVLPKPSALSEPSTAAAATAAAAVLEVHYTADRGSIRVIPAGEPYVVGRDDGPSVQLALREAFVSARQCVLLPPDSASTAFRLLDTSTNGTFVNGQLVGKNAMLELNPGDRLQFGRLDSFPCATFTLPQYAAAGAFTLPSADPLPGVAWRPGDWEHASVTSSFELDSKSRR